MAAIMTGIAVNGGFIPYGGTFLVFSDYARTALRLAALMGVRVIYVFSHDSIGLGEDGPTHQPIEHAATLRLMPNMELWRPADSAETMVAWGAALRRQNGPTALLLTRQNVPFLKKAPGAEIARGGYFIADAPQAPAMLFSTGPRRPLPPPPPALLHPHGVP